jgi:fermentation-respiration switch protein FrsA (DUF1100 family)
VSVRTLIALLVASLAAVLVGLAVAVRWLEPRFAFFPSAGEERTPRDLDVDFEPVSIATRDGEQLRGWWLRAPSPTATVVYFHGNGGNLSMWAPILADIVRHGYTVLAFDYRGYGLSTGRPSEQGLYRDVDAVVDYFGRDASTISPRVYWGRSLGVVMAAYGSTTGSPDGLVLESGFPSARSLLRGSPVLYVLSFLSSYRFPSAEFLRRRARPTPVLVLHGDDDHVVPIQQGRALFDLTSEPKQFVAIQGGDHNDASPADPATYWRAVNGFIAGLPKRRDDRP